MKNIARFAVTTLLLAVFLPLTVPSARATQPPYDGWLYGAANYARALDLQRQMKAPLIVYFSVPWCPYCHTLENQYFPAAPVQEYLRNVVKVRINPEDGPADRDIANRFGVRGYPSFFVIGEVNSAPRKLSPFKAQGPDWTPAQFADACRQASPSLRRAENPVDTRPQPVAGPRDTSGIKIVEIAPSATASRKSASASRNFIPNATLPAVGAVFTKYVEATGGASMQSRVTSRVVKGKIDVAGLSFGGRFEVYSKSAGKSLAVIDVEPMGLVKHCVDGRTVWFHSDNRSQDMNTPELAVLAAADFYREGNLANMYARSRLLGKIKEGYREVYVVEAAPRNGTSDMLYFDAETGLLIHRDLTRQTSNGPIRSQVYFGDWRNVDGVLLPFRLTQSVMNRTFVITLEEIKQNVPVDDTVFKRPAR